MLRAYTYTPYIWPMLLAALLSASIAVYSWQHRTVPGARPFAVQELFIALWAFLTAVEMAATPPVRILYHKLEAVAGIVAMSAILYFAAAYTSPGKRVSRGMALFISLGTLFAIAMIATNDLHHLLWTRIWVDQVVRVERGPLGVLLLGCVLLVPTLAIFLYGRLFLRSRGIYRGQALMLAIATALPVLTFLLEAADIHLLAPLDPVMLAWSVSSVLYAVAIFRFHMLGVVPLGRDTAIERMPNPVVILDAEDRIADFNPAAGQLFALARRGAIGRPASQAFAAHPSLQALLEQNRAINTEIMLEGPAQAAYFRLQVSPLTHPRGFHLGRLALLRDVTEQHRAQEQAMAQALEQQRVSALLSERERLARELHDDLSQVLAFVSAQGSAVRLQLSNGDICGADELVARLVEVARKADLDIRESILGLRVTLPEEGLMPALAHYLDQYERHYAIHTELSAGSAPPDGALEPLAEVQLLRIIQEALANARKHAHARCVHVDVAAQDGSVEVTVADDGIGFDPQQAAAGAGDGVGLSIMAERAAEIGGTLAVTSTPGQGTQVLVRVPLRAPG